MDKKQVLFTTFTKPERVAISITTVEEKLEEVKKYAEQQGYHCKGFSTVVANEKQYQDALNKNYEGFFESLTK